MMTWKQFKKMVESQGVTDNNEISMIDIGPNGTKIFVGFFENTIDISDDPDIIKDLYPEGNGRTNKPGRGITIGKRIRGKYE